MTTTGPNWLHQLHLTQVDVTLSPAAPWTLPDDPALLLRATLGNAMVRLVCVRPHGDCPRCDLRVGCEIPSWHDPGRVGGHAPRPLLPEVVTQGGTRVGPDAPWRVRCWLLGTAPRPSLVADAFVWLARAGLGRDRVPHRVVELLARGRGHAVRVIDDERDQARWPEPGELAGFCRTDDAIDELITTTPLCLNGASPSRPPTVGELLWAAISRVRQVARAQGVALAHRWPDPRALGQPWDEARWVPGERRSSEGGPHDLSGWAGRVRLGPELGPWADALAACEVLGLGRSTSAGRGRYSLN